MDALDRLYPGPLHRSRDGYRYKFRKLKSTVRSESIPPSIPPSIPTLHHRPSSVLRVNLISTIQWELPVGFSMSLSLTAPACILTPWFFIYRRSSRSSGTGTSGGGRCKISLLRTSNLQDISSFTHPYIHYILVVVIHFVNLRLCNLFLFFGFENVRIAIGQLA